MTPAPATLVVFGGRDARVAVAGFLAGCHRLTRDANALDLRHFVAWCEQHDLLAHSPAGDVRRPRSHVSPRPIDLARRW